MLHPVHPSAIQFRVLGVSCMNMVPPHPGNTWRFLDVPAGIRCKYQLPSLNTRYQRNSNSYQHVSWSRNTISPMRILCDAVMKTTQYLPRPRHWGSRPRLQWIWYPVKQPCRLSGINKLLHFTVTLLNLIFPHVPCLIANYQARPWYVMYRLSQDWYLWYWPSFVFSSHTHFAIIHANFYFILFYL